MVVMQGMEDLVDLSVPTVGRDSVTTFAQALKDKYIDQEEIDNNFVLPKDRKISTMITFVGFGKVTGIQKQLNRLVSIDLSSKNISNAGDIENLRGSLDQVRILDLANNLLNWDQVRSIIDCTPNLHDLILSNNRLSLHPKASSNFMQLHGLASLTLGQIFLNWTEFTCILSRFWPSIDQLDLWNNQLSEDQMKLDSEEPHKFIQTIRSLKLSFNSFANMEWLENIGPIQSLVELDISNCKLDNIRITDTVQAKLINLQILNISYNNINDWISISTLHRLTNLTNLVCHENPLFIRERHAKSLTIGRLSSIKSLNREEVTRNTRTDSEIFYIRHSFPEYQAFIKGGYSEFKINHPRYETLAQYYGLPEDLVRKQTIQKYITVELSFDGRRLSKKLPSDIRVANLKMLCKRLFQLRASSSISITCCESDPKLSYLLDKDGQTLNFFSIESGRTLMIQQLD